MVGSPEEYFRALGQEQIVERVYVASAVILLYDLILTLHLEISLVWLSRWNYTKALYLLTRYIPFAANALILYGHLTPSASGALCAGTFEAAGWLYLVGLDLAEVILVIRTWACWGRNKWVGIGLALWITVCQIPSAIFMYKFLGSLRFGSPVPSTAPNNCSVVDSNRLLWGNWLVFLLVEGVTLTLMVIFAYRTSREGTNTPLIKLIYTDGLSFYVCLFCVTSINIALTLALDNGFVAMASPVQSAIHSVLTTRIILNIREAASQRLDDVSSDLHLSDTDSDAYRSRISFALNPAAFNSVGGRMTGSDVSRRSERYGGCGNMAQVSVSTHATISHVSLPMAREAKEQRVVGRIEPDDDVDTDSIRSFPEDSWV